MRFLGHLRTQLGVNEIDVEITSNEPLSHFLKRLSDLLPRLQEVIKGISELRGEYLLLLNDTDINVYDEPENVLIKNSDIITIVPIVHGGGI